MPDTARLSINLATLRHTAAVPEMLDAIARHGIPAVSPWRDQVAEMGLAAMSARIRELGLKVSGLCRGGMFPASDSKGVEANLQDNFRAVDEAAELDADCLVLVCGGLPPGSRDLAGARAQVRDGIARLAEHAGPCGVRLAIEPLHPMYCADRSVVNTVAQALDICDQVGAGTGVAVDVYHTWWDPDLPAQVARAGSARLHAFHICDWLRETRDLLLDRGMMGDGVIDIAASRRLVEAQGYAGFHEVEIFSKSDWWTRPVDEVLATCITRHRQVC